VSTTFAQQQRFLGRLVDLRFSALTWLGLGATICHFGELDWESEGHCVSETTLYVYAPWVVQKDSELLLGSSDFRLGGALCRERASRVFTGERAGSYTQPLILDSVTKAAWDGFDLTIQFGSDWTLDILGHQYQQASPFMLKLPSGELIDFESNRLIV